MIEMAQMAQVAVQMVVMVLHVIRDRITAGIVMVILGAGGWEFRIDDVGRWGNDRGAHRGGMMVRSHYEGAHR